MPLRASAAGTVTYAGSDLKAMAIWCWSTFRRLHHGLRACRTLVVSKAISWRAASGSAMPVRPAMSPRRRCISKSARPPAGQSADVPVVEHGQQLVEQAYRASRRAWQCCRACDHQRKSAQLTCQILNELPATRPERSSRPITNQRSLAQFFRRDLRRWKAA